MFSWFKARLREPSSWVGMIKIATGVLTILIVWHPDWVMVQATLDWLNDPRINAALMTIAAGFAASGAVDFGRRENGSGSGQAGSSPQGIYPRFPVDDGTPR